MRGPFQIRSVIASKEFARATETSVRAVSEGIGQRNENKASSKT